MADLYVWSKYNATKSTVGTGSYYWNYYNIQNTTTGFNTVYWNRYNCNSVTSYEEYILSSNPGSNSFTGDFKMVYPSYKFDSSTGKFTVSGSPTKIGVGFSTGRGYYLNGSNLCYFDFSSYATNTIVTYSARQKTTYSQGSFIRTVIAAHNAYTSGARNSDGYWYVKGSSAVTTTESQGSYAGQTTGSYNAYTNNAANGSYWYVRGGEITNTTYSKSSYVGTVTAAQNAYTNNARNSDGYWYVRGGLANKVPTVVLNTENNKTLYEADTITISGTATDTDNGNVVTIKYKIAESAEKALTAAVSNGSNSIPFTKTLTFKAGKIYDGETAITDVLTDGNAYTLQVWAEDNQGGKSAIQSRSFHVVPNRAPSLNVNEVDTSDCIIDSDKFVVSGTCEDADGNDMKVGYRINGGNFTKVYNGNDGEWKFELSLGQLQKGQNTIAIEAIDSYDFKTSKTITLSKKVNTTQVLNGVARYTINPPSGNAKGILVWIQHHRDLTIDACCISMTDNAEQENFVQMTHTTTANMPNSTDILESEFVLETQVPKEKLRLKVEISRASADVSPAIKLISGVLE